MGCNSSKHPNNSLSNVSNSYEPYNKTRNNPLTEKEIEMRIESPKEAQNVTVGGVTYNYAWVSQRGYYPDGIIF